MIRSIYTATSSLITQENRQNNIINNMANAHTTWYKNDLLLIKSFDQVTLSNKDGTNGQKQILGYISLGSEIDDIQTIFTQGLLKETNKATDFAVEGRGFFVVNKNGNNLYTRDGNFMVSLNNTLVTTDYGSVLGRNLTTNSIEEIIITDSNFYLNENNEIVQNNEATYELLTADFEDYNTLTKVGDNYYYGENPLEDSMVFLSQGYLENSTVSLIEEMTNMITTMRNFETNQKIVQMLDETLKKATSEIGTVR